ncbi:hypothetical protein B0H66DRAFT_537352 [Apodospora peruviana]|uniref:Uncharacterized protein n=1 Tax=Apodospora peruviana TaxID=516989 RepID=A0AAE0M023_9PEZI|nr:hypothetical protein B0H66DRAFT_537352 [Apodospora peruviana]
MAGEAAESKAQAKDKATDLAHRRSRHEEEKAVRRRTAAEKEETRQLEERGRKLAEANPQPKVKAEESQAGEEAEKNAVIISTVIVDESHNAKNVDAQLSQALRHLSPASVFLLSGMYSLSCNCSQTPLFDNTEHFKAASGLMNLDVLPRNLLQNLLSAVWLGRSSATSVVVNMDWTRAESRRQCSLVGRLLRKPSRASRYGACASPCRRITSLRPESSTGLKLRAVADEFFLKMRMNT